MSRPGRLFVLVFALLLLSLGLSSCKLGKEAFRFRDNGDQTVTDTEEGRTWAQLAARTMSWKEADEYCRTLDLGGFQDWRLPTADELLSLRFKEGGGESGWYLEPVFRIPEEFANAAQPGVWTEEPAEGQELAGGSTHRTVVVFDAEGSAIPRAAAEKSCVLAVRGGLRKQSQPARKVSPSREGTAKDTAVPSGILPAQDRDGPADQEPPEADSPFAVDRQAGDAAEPPGGWIDPDDPTLHEPPGGLIDPDDPANFEPPGGRIDPDDPANFEPPGGWLDPDDPSNFEPPGGRPGPDATMGSELPSGHFPDG